MVGADAGEIVQGFAVAMKAGATKAMFDATHRHPPDRRRGVRDDARAGGIILGTVTARPPMARIHPVSSASAASAAPPLVLADAARAGRTRRRQEGSGTARAKAPCSRQEQLRDCMAQKDKLAARAPTRAAEDEGRRSAAQKAEIDRAGKALKDAGRRRSTAPSRGAVDRVQRQGAQRARQGSTPIRRRAERLQRASRARAHRRSDAYDEGAARTGATTTAT